MHCLRVVVVAVAAAACSVGCKGSGNPVFIDAAPQPDAMDLPDAGTDAGTDAGGSTARGHTGSGNVAGGVTARSANYKLIGTLGKGDGTASSASFKHRGGVIGGTQP